MFPARGQPAEALVRLALATLLQFMKGLTDRQTADTVRTRIDWKYLLCLELTHPGFDHTVLSEFHTRLLTRGAEGRLFEAVLQLARGRGLLKGGGRQRSDPTHVLGAMRTISRLKVLGEILHHALNALATLVPDWLRAHTTPAWAEQYGRRASEFRLPKSEAGRRTWARQTGIDGVTLLAFIMADCRPAINVVLRVNQDGYAEADRRLGVALPQVCPGAAASMEAACGRVTTVSDIGDLNSPEEIPGAWHAHHRPASEIVYAPS